MGLILLPLLVIDNAIRKKNLMYPNLGNSSSIG